MIVTALSTLDCTRLLEAGRVGHLACSKDGRPYVVPIHYAYGENALYAFSMPGKKIDFMRANPLVSVLVEEHLAGRGWRSVVVDGRFEELPDRVGHKARRDHAWSLLSRHSDWWEPGALKPASAAGVDGSSTVFFCIFVEAVSGRQATES